MSKLLDEAIEQLRELPEEEQNDAADVVFAYVSSEERQFRLRPDQEREVQRIRTGLQHGTTRLATNGEVSKLKKKVGV